MIRSIPQHRLFHDVQGIISKQTCVKHQLKLNSEAYVRPVSTACRQKIHRGILQVGHKMIYFPELFFDILSSALIQYLPLREQKPCHNIATKALDAGCMTFGAPRHVPYRSAQNDTVHVNYLF